MTNKLNDQELCELTLQGRAFALAECVEGLGCSVYAGGKVLAPWASHKVEELVGIHLQQGALITNQSEPRYFTLKYDYETEALNVLRGPLKADEVHASL